MAKKQSVLAILNILTEYSDEDHILTVKDIQNHLLNTYNLDLERRTIYSNINMLIQAGYAISGYDDNGKGYFLAEKQFDKGEVLLLCNAIHASHFISTKQSDKLIKKLLKTLSKHEAKEFNDNVYLPNNQKTNNTELMYNISLVSEAIRDKKMIKFTYNRYDNNKKLVPRREEPYIVEPRFIVYADSRPYLIATNKKYPDYVHYRLDRINKASLVEEKVSERKKNDAYEYAKNFLFMYGGDVETITFKCDTKVMDQMIDLFGTGLSVVPCNGDDEHFILHVQSSRQGAIFLAQQYLDSIEIIEPKNLRKEFLSFLEDKIKIYKKIGGNLWISINVDLVVMFMTQK